MRGRTTRVGAAGTAALWRVPETVLHLFALAGGLAALKRPFEGGLDERRAGGLGNHGLQLGELGHAVVGEVAQLAQQAEARCVEMEE